MVTAAVLLLAAVVEAPLLAQANPGMSPNPAKAPWYFMGLQELLVHLHPPFAVLVVPLLALALLVALPYLRYGAAERRVLRLARGRADALAAAAAGRCCDPRDARRRGDPAHAAVAPGLPPAIRNGLLPVLAACAVVAAV